MTIKLRAKDADDIQVVSAILQDAIVPVVDMIWQPEEKKFVMVTQRLCRETEAASKLNRVCCALNIDGVEQVQTHAIDLKDQGRMLDLLMMIMDGDQLQFLFAGGAKIRLQLSKPIIFVEDFGEPWPAGCNPCHEQVAGAKN